VARLPGLVPRPHLPPRAHARQRARSRLLVDWTVGLLFGRDSAELGQLGHPPVLGRDELREQSEGGTSADGTAEPAAATPVVPAP
jgi:NADH dehydrogenase